MCSSSPTDSPRAGPAGTLALMPSINRQSRSASVRAALHFIYHTVFWGGKEGKLIRRSMPFSLPPALYLFIFVLESFLSSLLFPEFIFLLLLLFFYQKNSSSYFWPSHFELATFLPNPKQNISKICLQSHSSINFINVLFPVNIVIVKDILFPRAESLPPCSKDVSVNCWRITRWNIYFSKPEVDPHLDVDRLTLFPL